MGSQVTAQCECGVGAEILVGGGMMDFTTTCYFPCLCDRCNKVVQVNLLATKPRCPDCGAANPVPYDDPQLIGSPGDEIVAEWNMEERLGRNLLLTDGSSKCPGCRKKTLRFADSGLWD